MVITTASRNHVPEYFFWRTYDRQEIDFLELDNRQNLQAIECKWQNRNAQPPVAFARAYPDADFTEVHRDNYLSWITGS